MEKSVSASRDTPDTKMTAVYALKTLSTCLVLTNASVSQATSPSKESASSVEPIATGISPSRPASVMMAFMRSFLAVSSATQSVPPAGEEASTNAIPVGCLIYLNQGSAKNRPQQTLSANNARSVTVEQ